MAGVGHNSGDAQVDVLNQTAQGQLRSVIERIENLIEDRSAINEDIKEVKAEAKGNGFDVPTIMAVIKKRAEDKAKAAEREALLDLYLSAIGL